MAEKILSFEEYYTKANAPKVEETAKETEEVAEETTEETEEVEESEEETETVSEMLKKCYEAACNEACAYENDDYPEHTLEEYLKENASLCASLGADTLEKAHAEVREGEMTKEIFEAACNEMKEAFIKKIDEVKEAWAAK
jgi:arginine utilization protein RocB